VHFYVAGNAVNNNHTNDAGDHVYTTLYPEPYSPFTCTNTKAPAITFIDSAVGFGGFPYFASGHVAGDQGHESGGCGRYPQPVAAVRFRVSCADGARRNQGFHQREARLRLVFKSGPDHVRRLRTPLPERGDYGDKLQRHQSASTSRDEPVLQACLRPTVSISAGKQYMVATFNSDGAFVLNPGSIAGVTTARGQAGRRSDRYGIGFGDVATASGANIPPASSRQKRVR